MTKVYAIYGYEDYHLVLSANGGKSFIKVVFSNGDPISKSNRPATYATKNPVEQHIIEHSPQFGRLISVHQTIGEEEPVAPVAPLVKSKMSMEGPSDEAESTGVEQAEENKSYPEVTTYEEAVAILKSLGAKAVSLTPDRINNTIKKLGVSFPNFNE